MNHVSDAAEAVTFDHVHSGGHTSSHTCHIEHDKDYIIYKLYFHGSKILSYDNLE